VEERKKIPCEERLKQPPPCDGLMKEKAPYVMCIAREMSKKNGVPIKLTLKDAWKEFNRRCKIGD
jgi:hypothetical protein